jgi:tropomyosin
LRSVDVKAEHFERQVQRIEAERDQWEARYEEANAKYLASKRELEETVQVCAFPQSPFILLSQTLTLLQ